MPDYKFPMFSRLIPLTPFTGGRVTDTDVLTLSDGASMATVHAGQTVTIGDILRAAKRGEIPLKAIIHRTAKVQGHDGGIFCDAGQENENIAPAGAVPTLPLSACEHLATTGRASWRTFDGFEMHNGSLCRYTKGILAAGEPDFETVPDDCRVMGYDVHALADAFKVVDDTKPQAAPALTADTVTAPVVELPETREQRQDRRLKACEDDRLVMPVNSMGRLPNGVGGVADKHGVSRQAFSTDVKAALKRREAITKPGRIVRRT